MEFKLAETHEELRQILEVQRENHPDALSQDQADQKGFVTVRHSIELIEQMNAVAPHVIAVHEGQVVGYALVMLKEFRDMIPVLIPMFEMFEQIEYKGRGLSDLNFYLMGQICVKDGFKRRGIFSKLYAKHKEVYSKTFDYCVTEVSSSNVPSMKAHEKLGFETIHSFQDETDDWHILLWDFA